MRQKLLTAMLLAAGSLFGSQISVGISIGPPPPPRVVRLRPVNPGPGFAWVDGYWYPVGRHYRWHDGYWTRAPYPEAVWVGPRWADGHFYEGYWNSGRGRFEHDHRWDRDRDRDYRDHDRGHDRGHDKDHDHDRR
jgi:hypothetical protein